MNSQKRPVITINAVGRVVGNRYEFGGYMSLDGNAVGPVTGELIGDVFATSRRRKGRPKNEPLKVAIALHEIMALSAIHEEAGQTRRLARIEAARALSIGGDDDDAEKYVRTHAKHEMAKAALDGHNRVLTVGGDSNGDGRLVLALRDDASLRVVGDALHIRGTAWGCGWRQREAFCGLINCVARTDAPHLLALLPSWARGGA